MNEFVIKGFETYILSIHGVRHREKKEFMKPHVCPNGYIRYPLKRIGDNKLCWKRFHRLIAEYFIPNPDNLPQVNHIDGNKKNNSVENLEWVSARQNVKHAIDIGLSYTKLNQEKADEIRFLYKTTAIRRKQLAEKYGVGLDTIKDVLGRKIWNW